VVAPRFDGAVELIPKAELEALLAEAQVANAGLALGAEIPAELEAAGLDIEIQGVNFQFVDPDEGEDLALSVPPIPGLLVVPGRIGLLNQFFSVMLFTENAAPEGSGLSVRDLEATLTLPRGPTRSRARRRRRATIRRFARVARARSSPGSRFARSAPTACPAPRTIAADSARDTGQSEFLVEG
jgi:hypothetical protein